MESECLLYVVNGKSLLQKANHYMDSVSFYHSLVMIYTVCLLLTIYMSIQIQYSIKKVRDIFVGKEVLHFIIYT